MFIDATPNDELLKTLKETEEKHQIDENIRIKMVSKTGTKLKNIIVKKNPFESSCKRGDCEPCRNTELGKSSDCRKQNITYQGKCVNCEDIGVNKIYDGETARNLFIRSKEHIAGYKNKNPTNFIHKHATIEHGEDENVVFKWKVTGKFRKPMQRQIFEAIKIDKKNESENLNSKSEYNGHCVRRLTLDKDLLFTCNLCSSKFKYIVEMKNHKKDIHEKNNCSKCNKIVFGQKHLQYHMKDMHKIEQPNTELTVL